MRLEQLLYFVETAERYSMSLAAEVLHTSHQNISKSIRQLEDELNTSLFKRSRTGVTLSPTGKKLFIYAKEALRNIDLIYDTAHSFSFNQPVDKTVSGTINVISSASFNSGLINAIKNINLHYPNITIMFTALEPAYINSIIANHTQDAHIFLTSIDPQTSFAESIEKLGTVSLIRHDSLKLLAHKNTPLSSYSSISMKKLQDIPLAFLRSSSDIMPLYLQLVKPHLRKLPKIYYSNSADIIQDYVYSGIVFSLTTFLTTRRPINLPEPQCNLIPLNIDISIDHIAFIPPKTKRIAAFNIFMQALRDSSPEMQNLVW